VGYHYLLHAIEFHITVVLVLGHDRLYSMLGTHFKNKLANKITFYDDMMGGVWRAVLLLLLHQLQQHHLN
jgi:hypothetical protein